MKTVLFLSALLITFFSAIGQTGKMSFKKLTPEMGLSHGDVVCLFQDHEGYMWIGTVDGLNKYDGVACKVYKYDQKDTTSLPNNVIISIYEDKKNNLWIGTASSNGLCRYNRENDNFERISYTNDQNKKFDFIITGFLDDKDNKLWVSSSNGIYWFDVGKRIFHPCFTDTYGKDILVNFNEIHQDKNGILWFISEDRVNGGIIRYNPVTKETDRYNTQHPIFKLKENPVYSFFIDKQENIWIGGYSTGLTMINEHSKRIINYQKEPHNENSLNDNFIPSLTQTSDGKILIGTNGGGLNVFDPVTKIFEHYTATETEGSLLSSSIKAIYTGCDGTIWLGCWAGGVNIYDKRFEKFAQYKHDEQTGYSFKVVTSFAEDSKGNIWIGSDGKGITWFNPKEKKFVRYLSDITNPLTLTNDKVLAVETDDKGGLWVGMWQGGLNYFQINGNKLILKKKYPYVDETDPRSNSVFRIYRNSAGEIWVGNFETGAYLFDPKTERFKLMFSLKDLKTEIKANSAIIDILSDYHGDVWLATLGKGLIRLNRKTGKYEHFTHDEHDSTSIISNGANVVFEDSKKRLWIGSAGLCLFNRKTNTFTNYTTAQGLPDNTIVGMLEDSNHNLWISSNNGISKATIVSVNEKLRLRFRNYSTSDGLQDKVFNKWAYFKSKNGEMYFGGISGFNAFLPDSIKDNPYLPPVHITDFLLFNKPVTIGAKDSPLKKHISQTQKIVLKDDQSVFTFRFIALNYIFSEKNQYAYKMEGFEKDWNYVGNKREATYTNLNPGNYVFKVKASNNDGIWNETGTSIKIVVLPAFWETWWFKTLIYLFLAMVIFLFVNFRIRFYRQQNNKLTMMVKERTLELEEINVSLEERQEEIGIQNEELQAQKETLQETNRTLEEKQEEIGIQNEELIEQRNSLEKTNLILTEQQVKINKQNKELDLYRNDLENLVDERTRELIIAKEKAEESDRLKSSFLANMSHEIRTPLNAIVGFSSLAFDETFTEEEKAEQKQIIQRSNDCLLALINDILDFSKIESGNIDIILEEISLKSLMARIQEIYKIQMNRQQMGIVHDLELKVAYPETMSNIYLVTDEIRLDQILANLIHNSIKFTPKGYIEVGCKLQKKENMVEFYVKDTGIGIKKENYAIIFERFRKIEDDINFLYRGSGIGLTISQHLVKLLGGRIRVESEFGNGTTFYFTVPIKKKPGANEILNELVPIENKVIDFKKSLVLVAEDDYTNYVIIEKMLQKYNINVLHAINGVQAVDMALTTNGIQLILMDIKMPILDGVQAYHKIRQKGNDVPIVAQTAYAISHEVLKFKKEGFDDYITKPIAIGDILKILKKYVKV